MNHYLSEKRIWLRTTPCVEVLDGKSILIIDGESEYQSRLTLSYENSDDHRTEKCTVSAQKTFEEAPLWQTPLPDTMPPPSQQRFRRKYFSQAALDLIREAVDSHHGEFVLVVPQE